MTPSVAAGLLHLQGRVSMADAAALSALVRDSVAADTPRQVLLVRLAPLAPRLRGEHHHRLLRETLEPLLRPSRARLYALPNGDLVAVGPERGWHMESVARRLATLMGEETTAPGVSLLALPAQAALVLAAIEEAIAEEERLPVAPLPQPPRRAATRDGPASPAVSRARLARALAAANITAFLRCRPVLRLMPGEEEAVEAIPLAQWTAWRIAVPELCAALLGDPAAAALAAGSAHLNGALEQRLLAALAEPEEATRRGPIGLSLGLAALESAAFRRLEGLVAPGIRARSVIGLAATVLLADPIGFHAARQVLAGRGWRLALEVGQPAALALLRPDRLGVELVQIRFDPILAATGLPAGLAPERVVLTGVDRPAALGWGMEAGIRLFEGRLLSR